MARRLRKQGMNCVNDSPPNPRWASNRATVAHDAFSGNCYALSLAALHEEAQSGLPALCLEAARWRQCRGAPRADIERTPATLWSYVQPVEAVQRDCRFLLREGRYRVGRAADNDLRFDCPGVSRRHAEIIVLSTRGVIVRDLGSVNGTRVDGVLIAEAAVDGAVILDLGPLRLNLSPDGQLNP
jgi:hypothetical protein